MSAVLEEVKRRTRILNPQRMGLAEQLRQEWVVNAEEGTDVEDVLEMGYWAHMAAMFQKFDHIEVRLETGEWIVNLIVTGIGRNWAAVHLVNKLDLVSVEEQPGSEKFKVAFGGPHHKWRVTRLADSEVIQAGFENRPAAEAWLRQYENSVMKG